MSRPWSSWQHRYRCLREHLPPHHGTLPGRPVHTEHRGLWHLAGVWASPQPRPQPQPAALGRRVRRACRSPPLQSAWPALVALPKSTARPTGFASQVSHQNPQTLAFEVARKISLPLSSLEARTPPSKSEQGWPPQRGWGRVLSAGCPHRAEGSSPPRPSQPQALWGADTRLHVVSRMRCASKGTDPDLLFQMQ